ncbi:HepT-like ribonuclease domain-containing protein [Algoriphagus litoralis]|uniref:HepT-like ribonuclease domain-containing protein n=1 Tax=Algoriphagus litoralis TaxID=2202829 RepID=UPI000DBA4052
MTDREQKYLIDILKSCERIIDFVGAQSFTDFLKDYKTQSAIERQLGIIGEALSQFRKTDSSLRLKSQNKIIGLRNRLIHA